MIKIVDVGARGKTRSELNALAPVAELYAFEPEGDAAEWLRGAASPKSDWRARHVVAEALGDRRASATLQVMRQPSLSSLREPDVAVAADYPYASLFEVSERQEVSLVTLDDAAERHGFRDACILKIDAPAYELEVLRGGEHLLRGSILGVFVETQMQPLYSGAPLFADVDQHLRQRGFELFDLRRSLWRGAEYSPDRFSSRRVVAANCLYLRSPRELIAKGDPLQLARLLALALATHHLDLAKRLVEVDPSARILHERARGDLAQEVDEYAERITRRIRRGRSDEDARRALQGSAKDARSA